MALTSILFLLMLHYFESIIATRKILELGSCYQEYLAENSGKKVEHILYDNQEKKGVIIKQIGVDHHKLRWPKLQSFSKTRDQHSRTHNTSLLVQQASFVCNFTGILFVFVKKKENQCNGQSNKSYH